MKVLFYINVLGGGGAERVIVNLANQFSRKDNTQVVLVASYPIDSEYFINSSVHKIYLDEDKRICKKNFCIRNLNYVKRLKKLINNEAPDTVVSFMAEPNIRMLIATMGMKHKKIISVRNDPIREYNNIVAKFFAKMFFGLADTIVFQTDEAKRFFNRKVQKKSVIIMNQIDGKFFDSEPVETRRNIVTAGRLTNQKNHKLLIDAFSKISDLVSDDLIIYGEGELKEELNKYIEQIGLSHRIKLPGATNNIFDVLRSSKMFVLSSDYEGMPNALLESMAMGVPCISTDCPCGGPRMVICNGINGILVPVNDIDAMAEGMLSLINDEDLQRSFSFESRATMANFRPENIIHEWEKVIFG